jgi:hypothetical protein
MGWSVVQVVEHLLCKHEVLSLNPSPFLPALQKKKKSKEKRADLLMHDQTSWIFMGPMFKKWCC